MSKNQEINIHVSTEDRISDDLNFYIKPDELILRFSHELPVPALSFSRKSGDFDRWQKLAKAQLAQLLGIDEKVSAPGKVQMVRESTRGSIRLQALILEVDSSLSIPAYLLLPAEDAAPSSAVIAIHGHGEVEPSIGLYDDYHHCFALELAKAGHVVLAPELRGFGALSNLAEQSGNQLSYWKPGSHMGYPLATDAMQLGRTMMGETIEDLLRWEQYLTGSLQRSDIGVSGISYGGDLALTYPIFSTHVRRIFASGTLGSFKAIFAEGGNAPAHCIPSVLKYLDRSDIAGLNAPCPIMIHYGELDKPSPTNGSASYNTSAEPAFLELQNIYKAFNAESCVSLAVSKDKKHEMDIPLLIEFFNRTAAT